MILTKEMLTKSLKKGREEAVHLLLKLSQLGGIPEPHFEYNSAGSNKRPAHFYKVRFRIPQFIIEEAAQGGFFGDIVVHGAGRCSNKKFAKSLAALEAIHRVEESLEVERGYLQKRLDDLAEEKIRKQQEFENFPIAQQLPGVSWENIPIDSSFSEILPAGRQGRIEFFPSLLDNPEAFLAAKAITLASRNTLPVLEFHANQKQQRWANIRAEGRIEGVAECRPLDTDMSMETHQVVIRTMDALANVIRNKNAPVVRAIVAACERGKDSSFGMAKLFVSLPKHQFQDLKLLLDEMKEYKAANNREETTHRRHPHQRIDRRPYRDDSGDALKARLASFRSHQRKQPLPVDSVEKKIPHDVAVTIVRGGTGSGKVRSSRFCWQAARLLIMT